MLDLIRSASAPVVPALRSSPAAARRIELPLIVAGIAVAATAAWPWQSAWPWVTGVLIVLGVPHGALDAEIARALLRPRFGKIWFGVFALPYLSLFAVVMVAWHLAPVGMLAAFLAASVWHFGKEEAADGDLLEVLFLGGLPIALPMLLHPAATAFVFANIAGLPGETFGPGVIDSALPPWLHATSLLWLLVASGWLLRTLARGDFRSCRQPTLLICVFVVLPPWQAFTLYFVCLHAPRHTGNVIASRHLAPRVHDRRSAWLLALPVTGLTLAIGAALWPLYDGPVATRLLTVTLQMLAALTLPHMLLDVATSAHVENARQMAAGKANGSAFLEG